MPPVYCCVGRPSAQELNCNVEVNSSTISGQDHVFETLQQAINDYMNTTRFTNAQFSPTEKIECRLFLTVREYADDIIKGDLQIQSVRPVFNSSYSTTLINFKDNKIEFTYRENEPLVFSENSMESNLTAILNFYAYLILAVDFDSYSPLGGQPYFDRLATIVQLAQSSGEVGWKAFEDNRNRSAVLSAFTDPQTSVFRQLMYQYHRRGLDEMSVSPDKGRANITQNLPALEKIYQASPMSVDRRRGYGIFRRAEDPGRPADDPGGAPELYSDRRAIGVSVPPLFFPPLPADYRHVPQRICPQRQDAVGAQRDTSGRSCK